MPDAVTNWFGNITSHPAAIVDAASVDDIAAVLKNPGRYPSPVRAVGSNHSTSPLRHRRRRHPDPDVEDEPDPRDHRR